MSVRVILWIQIYQNVEYGEKKREKYLEDWKDVHIFAPQLRGKHIPDDSCPDGGIGRRAGLKHQWSNIHPGSTPGLGTERKAK